LPARFVLNCLTNKSDGIHVFDLASRAERLTRAAHRHIHVGAQIALFHIAVAGTEIAED